MEALKLAEQEELRILTEDAFRMLGLSPQSLTEVGEAVQRDLREARRIAEPRFEIADLERAAQDVLREAKGRSDSDTGYLCETAAKISSGPSWTYRLRPGKAGECFMRSTVRSINSRLSENRSWT